ncbi:MAG: VIT and VWA domain-containing protein [Deltaproteobacteria bacterium]|jgi:Ca-activated chloride channel family protein|nr:VIT and VWA domain-containing protein [Deltaproteobacteria bacterium]
MTRDDRLSSLDSEISLQKMDAQGRLEGLLLEMSLAFHYRNQSDETREVLFTFPLVGGAVLLGLRSQSGGATLAGTVFPREEAQDLYEEALEGGEAPILVEKSAEGLISLSLGALAPQEELVLTVEYGQLLTVRDGVVRVVAPTVVAPRYGAPHRRGLLSPRESVDSDLLAAYPFALSLEIAGELAFGAISSPSHSLKIRRSDAGLIVSLDGKAYMDRDFILTIASVPGKALAARGPDGEGTVALASFFPERVQAKERAVCQILVDLSGSARGASLALAKESLSEFLGLLTPQDYLSLSFFGSETRHLFPKAVPASPRNVAAALASLKDAAADMGGTELEWAARSVLDDVAPPAKEGSSPPSLLIVTAGECWLDRQFIAEFRQRGTRVFIIGVGFKAEQSALRKLSAATGGTIEYLAPKEDPARVAQMILSDIRTPAAEELKVDWGAETRWETALSPYLYGGQTVHVFAGARDFPATPPTLRWKRGRERGENSPGAWSRSGERLARLAAAARLEGASPEKQRELSARYQLMSDYSSFYMAREGAEKRGAIPRLEKVPQAIPRDWTASVCQEIAVGAAIPRAPMSVTPTLDARRAPYRERQESRHTCCMPLPPADNGENAFGDEASFASFLNAGPSNLDLYRKRAGIEKFARDNSALLCHRFYRPDEYFMISAPIAASERYGLSEPSRKLARLAKALNSALGEIHFTGAGDPIKPPEEDKERSLGYFRSFAENPREGEPFKHAFAASFLLLYVHEKRGDIFVPSVFGYLRALSALAFVPIGQGAAWEGRVAEFFGDWLAR